MQRSLTAVMLCVLFAAAAASHSTLYAQPPEDQAGPPERARGEAPSAERIVARMMAFDKNKDGKLTRDEITDPRLLRLFDRADANHDGVVTKAELTDLAKKMIAETSQSGFGGPDGGPGGFGPPGGFRPFGPGGQPPRPGQILAPRLRETLKLTAEQAKQLEALQKEIDARFAKILSSEQRDKLKEFQGGPPEANGPPPEQNGRSRDGNGPPRDDF